MLRVFAGLLCSLAILIPASARAQLADAPPEKRVAFEPVMVVYRTMANLHYTDRSLDPSKRAYGSLFSDRPDLMNMQFIGFGRIVTPGAWLSTWSGLSSNADFCKNVASVTVPVLIVNALRDREIHPGDAKKMWDAVKSDDRTFLEEDAEHYFEPEFGAKTAPVGMHPASPTPFSPTGLNGDGVSR